MNHIFQARDRAGKRVFPLIEVNRSCSVPFVFHHGFTSAKAADFNIA
jgi:hypothetical protein